MEDKQKELDEKLEKEIKEDEKQREYPTPPEDETTRYQNARKALDNDLTRYGAGEYLDTTEADDEQRFDKIISVNTAKQWIFTILTAIIIILAIADIFFGIGKIDKWVYLFGVLTAYEANESHEKNVITKEYKKSRLNTRNILKSISKFRGKIEIDY